MHYQRWRKYGDPLVVSEIHGDDDARFESYIDRDGPTPLHRPELGQCWLWNGERNRRGYGRFNLRRKHVAAHRHGYERAIGPIPEGLQIDHLCRNPSCVNPAHLEAVTCRENLLRGNTLQAKNAAKTHCFRGHEFTPENTYHPPSGGRVCRTCQRQYHREWRAQRAAA
jgi:hypothetical protein